jgi:hypothetical protein
MLLSTCATSFCSCIALEETRQDPFNGLEAMRMIATNRSKTIHVILKTWKGWVAMSREATGNVCTVNHWHKNVAFKFHWMNTVVSWTPILGDERKGYPDGAAGVDGELKPDEENDRGGVDEVNPPTRDLRAGTGGASTDSAFPPDNELRLATEPPADLVPEDMMDETRSGLASVDNAIDDDDVVGFGGSFRDGVGGRAVGMTFPAKVKASWLPDANWSFNCPLESDWSSLEPVSELQTSEL